MIAAYSTPAEGFMSLWPVADLGNDRTVALWKAGIRSAVGGIPIAKGRALLILDGGRPTPVRIQARNIQSARLAAVKASVGHEVVLLEAVAHGARTVFRRTEIIRPMSPAAASKDDANMLIGPSGELVEKVLSPFDPHDQKIIGDRLASQIGYYERLALGKKLKTWLDGLDKNWARMTPRQVSAAITTARNKLRRLMGASANKLLPIWKTKIELTLRGTMLGAKKVLRSNFLPQVGLSFRQPDLDAIRNLTDQQGFWLRDASGRRADHLTRQGQKVIQDGLKQGLGREQIARAIRTAVPAAWQKYGMNYFRTLSAVSVSRARSFSEVSGYTEAGIEALEIQAVLDERTTEICRCLDGQIIEVNLVSQQIAGAMNVSRPEDIKDASPFLKETINPKTGVSSIVTANNNTKVADVTRSGMGRVDDRGQFNRYLANNGLTSANLGPPPYHHLCRSWTVPVTTTVQVPRNMAPRGKGPSSPTPPKVVPPGKKPPPGVGARPQSLSPKPSPSKPTMVGDPDLIERYPMTEDFVSPPPLPPHRFANKATGEMKSAAVYRRYEFDAAAQAIRGKGNISQVRKPMGTFTPAQTTDELVESLNLAPSTSGVAMQLERVDIHSIRNTILAEAKQPSARRLYSMTGTMDKRQRYLKFNGDQKRASRNWLHNLRKAETVEQMNKAIGQLEQKGFVQITKNPNDIMFGQPAPRMTPKPGKVPPRVKPAPKKRPATEPRPRPVPKPRPQVTHPRVPGQAPPARPKPKPRPKPLPKPKKVDPYSEYALVPKDGIKKQVETRIRLELGRVNDALAQWSAKFPGRAANPQQQAIFIRDYCEKATGTVKKITKAQIGKNTAKMTKWDQEIVKKTVTKEMQEMPRHLYHGSKIPKFSRVPQADLAVLYNDAATHMSPRMWEALKKKGLPRVHWVEGWTNGGWHQAKTNTIFLPRATTRHELQRIFRHELGHAMDELGMNREAIRIGRNRWRTSGRAVTSSGGWKYHPGKWCRDYMGRIYNKTLNQGEIHSVLNELFAPEKLGIGSKGTSWNLKRQWEVNPESIAQWVAWMNGAYIP